MRTLLGIDIGTSSIKAMMLDIASGKIYVKKRRYSVSIPAPNCAEQNPELWWENLVEIFQEFRSDSRCRKAFESVVGISFSGQMHGLVSIDEYGKPVRPAIIWLDQRSVQEVDEILGKLSEEEINTVLGNRICVGFSCPSLLWIKKNEPENYKKIWKVFQPKDYIRFKMTGEIATEVTDASASGIYDVKNRRWAKELIRRVGLSGDNFPDCYESGEIAGYVTMKCAELTGLKEGIPVLYGCGDQMAQSIGNGVYQEGKLISNIGTGGQVSAYSNEFVSDRRLRTNTFCHAVGKGYSVFGATLNSGNSLNWLCNKVLGEENQFEKYTKMAEEIEAGSEGVVYLPYLSGERTPVMDSKAKGVYFGLKLQHDSRHLIRATMEGIIYSLKDCLLILQELGIDSDQVIASGGGASSELFLQLQADIFEKEIKVCNVKEQACLGACILAGAGTQSFTIEDAVENYVTFDEKIIVPISEHTKIYRKYFEIYHEIYKNTKQIMEEIK